MRKMHATLYILVATLCTSTFCKLPPVPVDIQQAAYKLHDIRNYELVENYIKSASPENLIILDLFLEGAMHTIRALEGGRFGNKEIIVGGLFCCWGLFYSFIKNISYFRHGHNPTKAVLEGFDSGLQALPPASLKDKGKQFLKTYAMWLIESGAFILLLALIPASLAELYYHRYGDILALERLAELRFLISMKQQKP